MCHLNRPLLFSEFKNFKKCKKGQRNGFCIAFRLSNDFQDENDENENADRQFIINFSLATDTFMIYEQPTKNSGRVSGKFLTRTRIPKPGCDINNPNFYGPQDLGIGSVVVVFNRRFKIIDADVFVLTYLKENKGRFPGIEKTIATLEELHKDKLLGAQLPSDSQMPDMS